MPPKGRCRGSPSAAKSGDTVTDERVGVFTPDKDGYTHTSRGRVAVLAAREARDRLWRSVAVVSFNFRQPTIHTRRRAPWRPDGPCKNE